MGPKKRSSAEVTPRAASKRLRGTSEKVDEEYNIAKDQLFWAKTEVSIRRVDYDVWWPAFRTNEPPEDFLKAIRKEKDSILLKFFLTKQYKLVDPEDADVVVSYEKTKLNDKFDTIVQEGLNVLKVSQNVLDSFIKDICFAEKIYDNLSDSEASKLKQSMKERSKQPEDKKPSPSKRQGYSHIFRKPSPPPPVLTPPPPVVSKAAKTSKSLSSAKKSALSSKSSKDRGGAKFSCDHCGFKTDRVTSFTVHMKTHLGSSTKTSSSSVDDSISCATPPPVLVKEVDSAKDLSFNDSASPSKSKALSKPKKEYGPAKRKGRASKRAAEERQREENEQKKQVILDDWNETVAEQEKQISRRVDVMTMFDRLVQSKKQNGDSEEETQQESSNQSDSNVDDIDGDIEDYGSDIGSPGITMRAKNSDDEDTYNDEDYDDKYGTDFREIEKEEMREESGDKADVETDQQVQNEAEDTKESQEKPCKDQSEDESKMFDTENKKNMDIEDIGSEKEDENNEVEEPELLEDEDLKKHDQEDSKETPSSKEYDDLLKEDLIEASDQTLDKVKNIIEAAETKQSVPQNDDEDTDVAKSENSTLTSLPSPKESSKVKEIVQNDGEKLSGAESDKSKEDKLKSKEEKEEDSERNEGKSSIEKKELEPKNDAKNPSDKGTISPSLNPPQKRIENASKPDVNGQVEEAADQNCNTVASDTAQGVAGPSTSHEVKKLKPTATIKPTIDNSVIVQQSVPGDGKVSSAKATVPVSSLSPSVSGGGAAADSFSTSGSQEGDSSQASNDEVKYCEEVMHLLPVENADGTVTYMLISLDNEESIRAESIVMNGPPSEEEGAIYIDKGNLTSAQLLQCIAQKSGSTPTTTSQPLQIILQPETSTTAQSDNGREVTTTSTQEYVLLATEPYNQ